MPPNIPGPGSFLQDRRDAGCAPSRRCRRPGDPFTVPLSPDNFKSAAASLAASHPSFFRVGTGKGASKASTAVMRASAEAEDKARLQPGSSCRDRSLAMVLGPGSRPTLCLLVRRPGRKGLQRRDAMASPPPPPRQAPPRKPGNRTSSFESLAMMRTRPRWASSPPIFSARPNISSRTALLALGLPAVRRAMGNRLGSRRWLRAPWVAATAVVSGAGGGLLDQEGGHRACRPRCPAPATAPPADPPARPGRAWDEGHAPLARAPPRRPPARWRPHPRPGRGPWGPPASVASNRRRRRPDGGQDSRPPSAARPRPSPSRRSFSSDGSSTASICFCSSGGGKKGADAEQRVPRGPGLGSQRGGWTSRRRWIGDEGLDDLPAPSPAGMGGQGLGRPRRPC